MCGVATGGSGWLILMNGMAGMEWDAWIFYEWDAWDEFTIQGAWGHAMGGMLEKGFRALFDADGREARGR